MTTLGFGQEVITLPDTQEVREFILLYKTVTPAKSFKTHRIDQKVIDEKQGASLADLLQQNSSVFIKTYGQGSLATASIRGTGASHAKVYWNGIELNQPSLGQIDFSLLPVSFADDIELHLGNSSMVDGFGGLGGSIQMSNLPSYNKKLKLQLQSSLGSFSDYRSFVKISTGSDKISYKGSFILNDAKNDFEFDNIAKAGSPRETQRNAQLLQKATTHEVYYKFNTKHELSLKGFYTETDREIPALMTSTLPSQQSQNDRLLLSTLQYRYLGKNYLLKVASGWAYSEMDYLDGDANIDSRNFNSGFKNQARFNYYFNERLQFKSALFLDFDQAKTAGYDNAETQDKSAILLGTDWKPLKHWEIELFVRPEMVNDTIVPFLPSVGISYQPFLQQLFTINATWARNFHFPSLNDLYWTPGGNRNLKPESGWNAELSLRKKSNSSEKKWQYDLDVTGFYGEIEDWILWAPTDKGYWEANNLKSVIHKGIESQVQLGYQFKKWKTSLNLSYSYIESTNASTNLENDASVDKQLIYVPHHKMQYEWGVQRSGYKLVVGYQYTGKRYTTTDNFTYLPEYDLVNVRVNKRFKLSNHHLFFIQGEVNNLNDKSFMSLPWRAMPGRNYRITVRYTLDK